MASQDSTHAPTSGHSDSGSNSDVTLTSSPTVDSTVGSSSAVPVSDGSNSQPPRKTTGKWSSLFPQNARSDSSVQYVQVEEEHDEQDASSHHHDGEDGEEYDDERGYDPAFDTEFEFDTWSELFEHHELNNKLVGRSSVCALLIALLTEFERLTTISRSKDTSGKEYLFAKNIASDLARHLTSLGNFYSFLVTPSEIDGTTRRFKTSPYKLIPLRVFAKFDKNDDDDVIAEAKTEAKAEGRELAELTLGEADFVILAKALEQRLVYSLGRLCGSTDPARWTVASLTRHRGSIEMMSAYTQFLSGCKSVLGDFSRKDAKRLHSHLIDAKKSARDAKRTELAKTRPKPTSYGQVRGFKKQPTSTATSASTAHSDSPAPARKVERASKPRYEVVEEVDEEGFTTKTKRLVSKSTPKSKPESVPAATV